MELSETGMNINRRAALLGMATASAPLLPASAQQDVVFFRIGTGGNVGTYFPIGGMIANAISNPPGSRACSDGGSCGVPNMIATAVATDGSAANVAAIAGGRMQSGFVQADIAYWAATGSGTFAGRPKVESLRAITNLYPESVHVVARKGLGIASIADLKGKRVALDEPGSGTLIDARLILAAFGLSETDVQAQPLKARAAGERLMAGTLDAFFSVAGWPEPAIAELASSTDVSLVPIEGPQADALVKQHTFFARDEIPRDAYKGVEAVKTISVNALWVSSTRQSDELIYAVTAALWHPNLRRLLDSGHPKARSIRLETALDGVAIPLHDGAQRFYREKGLLK
jgi:TRAP transporter TAXI family solute receptor